MRIQDCIALFGGSFDPVHAGHLRAAIELQEALRLSAIYFIPCHIPVHKKKLLATPEQRLAMLKLAIQPEPTFFIDTREIAESRPSYTIETVKSMRQDAPEAALLLVLGDDVFSHLSTWHAWESLLQYCHIVVLSRTVFPMNLDPLMTSYLQEHQTEDLALLKSLPAGCIYLQTMTCLPISSSLIKRKLILNENIRFLLPDTVLSYIQQERLYRG